ncbi:MAG: DUF4337 domain-containing protein [Acidobacteriaceae bacterium]|nr:DUF4337 domain-containing protein [Acidobacteriaceae bacterium]MBV9443955.1 DUF4337 domain-containing protein [Acidobacteriaceae bacterium]
MSADEEVREHAEQARDPFDKIVAACMAIIAALLAVVSVLGQHYNTEELLHQQKASDQWAFSQAKDIRRYIASAELDSLVQIHADGKVLARYAEDAKKYDKQHADIQEAAKEFEKERDESGRRASKFHFGEVFLELAIVLSSLAILSKRRMLFLGGLGSALIGLVWAGVGFIS